MRYSERLVKKRFIGEMLKKYLSRLGIEAFNGNLYISENSHAILIEKKVQLRLGLVSLNY